MRFMQTESVLQTKNRFSVAVVLMSVCFWTKWKRGLKMYPVMQILYTCECETGQLL